MNAAVVDAAGVFLRRAQPRRIDTRGGPVECVVTGEGPALLSIHGGIGGYDQGLRVAAAALGAARRTVIAVSRPGYLGTPLSAGATPAAQADLFADILDALHIGQADVMAISAGGPSAIEFAIRHPARCRSLALISACTGRLEVRLPMRVQALRVMARWPSLVTAILRRLARDPEKMAGWLISDPNARTAIRGDAESRALLIELQREILARLAPRMVGTEHDLRLMGAMDDLALEQVRVPVLALHGTADEIVSFVHAVAVAKRVRGAQVVAIEGGEHVCLFTHREAVRARVRDFFALDAGAVSRSRRQARNR
jgi:pimeloyl-ACP methyl ester carboxylesterase